MNQNNEFAFPSGDAGRVGYSGGLTKREYFALHIMQGIFSNSGNIGKTDNIFLLCSKAAIQAADALLAELAKHEGEK